MRKKRFKIMIFIFSFIKKITRVNENKVLFATVARKDLTGNFEYIKNYIDDNEELKYVTFLKGKGEKPSFFELTSFYINVCTSKYIILDDYMNYINPLEIKVETKVVQLWHACGAFKTFGWSRQGLPGGPNLNKRNLTHNNYTDCICSAKGLRKIYAEAFGVKLDRTHATGIPRTDIFFDEKYISEKKDEFIKKYPQIVDKKVILFAPTFRGNGARSAYYPIEQIDFKTIYSELKNNYVFLIKMHPFVYFDNSLTKGMEDFYIDISSEREVNDILFSTDILVTDYSSIIFEYSLLNKPVVFHCFDLEQYIEKRGFYYDYEEYIYGRKTKNTSELIKAIKEEYLPKENTFINKFMENCDGKSANRVNKMIFEK